MVIRKCGECRAFFESVSDTNDEIRCAVCQSNNRIKQANRMRELFGEAAPDKINEEMKQTIEDRKEFWIMWRRRCGW